MASFGKPGPYGKFYVNHKVPTAQLFVIFFSGGVGFHSTHNNHDSHHCGVGLDSLAR